MSTQKKRKSEQQKTDRLVKWIELLIVIVKAITEAIKKL